MRLRSELGRRRGAGWLSGYQLKGYRLNGDQLNGDQLNGDQLNGYQLKGYRLNGDSFSWRGSGTFVQSGGQFQGAEFNEEIQSASAQPFADAVLYHTGDAGGNRRPVRLRGRVDGGVSADAN